MNVYVLLGHQNPGSFCHAIAAAAVEELKAAGHDVVYSNLVPLATNHYLIFISHVTPPAAGR